MTHQTSEPFVSQHNGLIERFHRTVEEKTRALLLESGFPITMWNIGIAAAEYVYNRTPHSEIDYKTPYEMWFGYTDSTHYMVTFGSQAYTLLQNRKRSKKFQPVAKPLYVCGFTSTGYLLYNPATKLIERSCNVKVDEKYTYRMDFPSVSGLKVPQFCFSQPSPEELPESVCLQDTGENIIGPDLQNELNGETNIQSESEAQMDGGQTGKVEQGVEHLESADTQESVREIDLSMDVPYSLESQASLGSGSSVLQSGSQLTRQIDGQFTSIRPQNRTGPRGVKIRDCTEQDSEASSSDTEDSVDFSDHLSEEVAEVQLSLDLPLTQTSTVSPNKVITRAEVHTVPPSVEIVEQVEADLGSQSEATSQATKDIDKIYLNSLRIPDKINKQDEFLRPHPEAPTSFRQVLDRPDRDCWLQAINHEIQSMTELGVWEPVERNKLREKVKPLPWNWVFTLKNGKTPKARLVVVGSRDDQWYQHSETFSLVPSPTVIRWFFSVALRYGLRLCQLDVKTAFLYSPIPYTKYTMVPDGVNFDRSIV